MNLCNIGSGELFITDFPGTLEELEIAEVAPEYPGLDDFIIKDVPELTLTFNTRLSLKSLLMLMGLKEEIYNQCNNKHIVHLAENARKHKVRKKNLRRAIRILERSARYDL